LVAAAGGEVTDPKGDAKCLLDQPAALEALQFWQDLIWKQNVIPQPAQASALGSGNQFDRALTAGERNGSWLIRTYVKDNPALSWDTHPNPIGPSGKRFTFHTTDSYLMFKNASSGAPDAAWQLLRWVSGLEWG